MANALAGKRILVVEDEYFIAADLKRFLKKEGAIVVGPVGKLEAGMSLAGEALDGAVLDVNLEPATSYPIADRLADRGVPFLFLTGYDGWSMPVEYRDAARVAKPFATNAVVSMMEELLSADRVSA